LRYLTYQPLAWTEEAARYIFIWVCMLGAVVAARRGQHFAVDVLGKALSPPRQRVLLILLTSAEAAFYLFLAVAGFTIVPIVNMQESPSLSMPMSLPYLAIPVAAILIAACQGWRAIRLVSGKQS
jgi:TRAP-type C4-dicarboxylate transport system permease small subunit